MTTSAVVESVTNSIVVSCTSRSKKASESGEYSDGLLTGHTACTRPLEL